jgi:hypothetical protein
MGTSPDVGGRYGLGRPQELDYRELETTAQVQVTKEAMGITPNTLEVPFTQLGGEPWKYKASPSKPEFSMTLLSGISYPDTEKASKLEKEQFEKLLKERPLKMSMELKNQNRIPLDERDGRYLVLDQLMKFFSKFLTWVKIIEDVDPASFVENTSKAQATPSIALNNWLEIANEIVGQWNAINDKDNETVLKNLIQSLNRYRASEGVIKEKNLKNILTYTNSILLKYKQRKYPNLRKLTGNLIESLVSILTALSSKGGHFGVWALENGKLDLIREQDAGYFGVGYMSLFQRITEVLPELMLGQKEPLKSFFALLVLGFLGAVSEAAGITARGNEQKLIMELPNRVGSFSVTLAISLLAHTRVIQHVGKAVLDAFEIKDKNNRLRGEIINLMSLNVLVFAGSRGSKAIKSANPLFKGMRPQLSESLSFFKSILEEYDNSPVVKRMALSVRQAEIAVQKGNLSGYLEAVESLINLWLLKLDTLEEESEWLTEKVIRGLQVFDCLFAQNRFVTVVTQAA